VSDKYERKAPLAGTKSGSFGRVKKVLYAVKSMIRPRGGGADEGESGARSEVSSFAGSGLSPAFFFRCDSNFPFCSFRRRFPLGVVRVMRSVRIPESFERFSPMTVSPLFGSFPDLTIVRRGKFLKRVTTRSIPRVPEPPEAVSVPRCGSGTRATRKRPAVCLSRAGRGLRGSARRSRAFRGREALP